MSIDGKISVKGIWKRCHTTVLGNEIVLVGLATVKLSEPVKNEFVCAFNCFGYPYDPKGIEPAS